MNQKKLMNRKESGFIDPYTLGFLLSLIGVGATYITTQKDEALQPDTHKNLAEQTPMGESLLDEFSALKSAD